MISEQTSCFDQNTLHEGLVQSDQDGFSKEQSFTHQNLSSTSALEMEIQNQLNLEIENCYNNNNNDQMQNMIDHTHNMVQQEMVQNPNWQEMNSFHVQNNHFNESLYPTTPDLLNMFPLPRCSTSTLLPNSSISFSNSGHNKASSSFLTSLGLLGHDLNSQTEGFEFDPMLPLNLQPQPPMLKELFHSLPFANHASLFDESNSTAMNSGVYNQDGDGGHNGVFMFTAGEMDSLGKNNGKDSKHFATEKHRRVLLNDKYQALRKLIPSPNKNDRASIVEDAINYINELKRTLNELQILIEKKRCARERLKRAKPGDDEILEQNGSNNSPTGDMDNPYNNGSSLRSSWLHRKSKNIEVDVRIIDDEVNVKLVQQKRVNCLLFVSRVLDELQLDLHHVAGGLIGDYYSFLFNSKISEGSIVYASAIADKLIEVVDKQYAAIPPPNSY